MGLALEKSVELSDWLGLRKEGERIEMMAELRAQLLLEPHTLDVHISTAVLSSGKPRLGS